MRNKKKKIFKTIYCMVFVLVITIASLSTISNTRVRSTIVAYNENPTSSSNDIVRLGSSGGGRFDPDQPDEESCSTLINNSLMGKINKNVLIPLKIIAPILLLVLTTIDFAKIVFSENDKDGMPKAWKNFLKRAIATLIIFFASNIVTMIYGFVKGVGFCWNFNITADILTATAIIQK